MPEPPDIYSDTYQINTNPSSAVINFMLTSPIPTIPGTQQPSERVVTVRMSLEGTKLLAFLLHRQLNKHEENLGVTIQVPKQILNALQIGLEDWQSFWGRGNGR